jgi:hypothetical protein
MSFEQDRMSESYPAYATRRIETAPLRNGHPPFYPVNS